MMPVGIVLLRYGVVLWWFGRRWLLVVLLITVLCCVVYLCLRIGFWVVVFADGL